MDDELPVEALLAGYDQQVARLTRELVVVKAQLAQRDLELSRLRHNERTTVAPAAEGP